MRQRRVCKRGWYDGPWIDEPDDVEWADNRTGYSCRVWRSPNFGSLCGYVDVPKGHPAYGKHYDNVPVEVHGGLTFAEGVDNTAAWRFGFDCGHYMDLCPGALAEMEKAGLDTAASILREGTYRDLKYVRTEVEHMAQQLKAMEEK